MSAERDDDPTGIRRLLSGMSDPAPMSEDLVRRISEDIEQERRITDGPLPQRFDPAVSRPRRRSPLVVGSAVVLLGVVLAAAGVVLTFDTDHFGDETVEAAPPARQVSAPQAALTLPGAGNPTATHVTVVSSGTAYHRGRLEDQVRELVAHQQGAEPSRTTPDPHGLEACLRSLALDGHTVLVDVATFDGHPSLTVIGDAAGDDSRTVAVMPSSCGESDRTPLAGPYRFR